MLFFTGRPKKSGGYVRGKVEGLQSLFPTAHNFVELIGIDMLLCIREFLHLSGQQCLNCFKNLMLTNKRIYKRLYKSKLLNRIIAQDAFSFNYLKKVKGRFHTYGDLIQFRDNTCGSHLSFNEYESSQFLKNAKLASKLPYVLYLRITVEEQVVQRLPAPSSHCYIRVKTSKVQIKRIKHLLSNFEQTHNGIAMRIFLPTNHHLPFNQHNSTLWVLVNKNQPLQFPTAPFLIGLKIELKLVNFRYYYRLHLCKLFSGVFSDASALSQRKLYLACTHLLEQE